MTFIRHVVVCSAFILMSMQSHAQKSNKSSGTINEEVTYIHHYDKGYSPLFRVYLSEILKTTLDKSIEEYGPYKIQFYPKYLSTNRSKLEAEKGTLIDMLFASHWSDQYVNPNNMIAIKLPIFDGLLGLRSLVTTKNMDDVFNNIQTKQAFTQYIAGQGANWEDVEILRSNQITVTEAQHFDALFPMLSKNRYDYMPLSSLEVQTALRTKGATFTNLVCNKSVGIFYPMPFYLFVNGKRPRLAERLKRGFEIAVQDGSIESLFDRHFGFIKSEFEGTVKSLVILKNPMLNNEENIAFTDQFLSKHQSFFDVID